MTDALAHRGPNGEGHWANEYYTVLLGHRRLSIIDLSDKGSQPMHCLGRYTIIHNLLIHLAFLHNTNYLN